jgi:uncharacterized GH25 family protein
MQLRTLLLAAALLLATPLRARAHDFWIEPASHRPAAGSILTARLFMGHASEPEAYVNNPKHIAEFLLVGQGGRQALVGKPGEDPAGRVRVEAEGTYVLAYRSNPSVIDLEAEKFDAYLREKGLAKALAEREARGESEKPGSESYFRCAKALLRTRGAPAGAPDLAVGMPLEFVLTSDPYAGATGSSSEVSARLLLRGSPLEGALVTLERLDAAPSGGPGAAEEPVPSAATDARGEVAFQAEAGGRYKLVAVHMERAPEGSPQAWQSIWAALTLETTGPKAGQAAH